MELSDPYNRKIRSRDLAIDLDVLRSFVAVAELGNVTRAAHVLGKAQSTISTHIRRVEEVYGCSAFLRSKSGVALSEQGAVIREVAERILQLHDFARAEIGGRGLAGRLRIGIMDDFAIDHLPMVLRRFAAGHPGVRLDLRMALSGELHEAIEARDLDVAVARRPFGERGGYEICREHLCWVSNATWNGVDADGVLPLVMFPPACLYRGHVTDALEAARRPWRITCTSGSLAGVCAATFAGFGITVLAESTIPATLRKVPESAGLPSLSPTEIAIFVSRDAPKDLSTALIEEVRATMRPVKSL